MPMGPGKYDRECETLRLKTNAAAALVIILGGDRGNGFSMTVDVTKGGGGMAVLANVPAMLRSVAKQIEESAGQT